MKNMIQTYRHNREIKKFKQIGRLAKYIGQCPDIRLGYEIDSSKGKQAKKISNCLLAIGALAIEKDIDK